MENTGKENAMGAKQLAHASSQDELPTVLVNVARWDGPDDLDPSWAIVNAPRPLAGERTWTGECRCGTFYAAGPLERYLGGRMNGWRALDARRVEFIDNAEIERRVRAYCRDNGYGELEDIGVTVAEQAPYMDPPLPWV